MNLTPKPEAASEIEPLRGAIQTVVELSKKIVDAADLMQKNQAELQRLTDSATDLNDKVLLGKIMETQGRLALLPGVKKNAEAKLEERMDALKGAVDRANREMQTLMIAEVDREAAAAESALKPFAPPQTDSRNGEVKHPAKEIARTLPKMAAISYLGAPDSSWPAISRPPEAPEAYDKSALDCARATLAKLETYMRQERSFLPKNWGAA